jgi:hypothetical protein
VARYIKKFGRIGQALGQSEEGGFALLAGYDIVVVDDDLGFAGLINVDDWSAEQLRPYDITTFIRVEPDDVETYRKLNIERKR